MPGMKIKALKYLPIGVNTFVNCINIKYFNDLSATKKYIYDVGIVFIVDRI